MDDDDDIFNAISKPAETKAPETSSGSFESGLGGFSFEANPPPSKPANDDPFNILGLDMPSNVPPPPPANNSNNLMGGDIFGFGVDSTPSNPPPPPQPSTNSGFDLMGFGSSTSS
jgi:hypothetical protein